MLHFWNDTWPLLVETCPCDAHFVEWLAETGVTGASIFHFGTGEHHLVGIDNAEAERGNAVLAITASPKEIQAYVDLVIARPEVARGYVAFFGDIYLLNGALLPAFDVVTLFHVGEFWSEKNAAYGGMTDAEMVAVLFDKVRPGGHLLFYTGSYAFDKARPIIDDLVARGLAVPAGTHRTLEVIRKAG